jgi:hypothetical protein
VYTRVQTVSYPKAKGASLRVKWTLLLQLPNDFNLNLYTRVSQLSSLGWAAPPTGYYRPLPYGISSPLIHSLAVAETSSPCYNFSLLNCALHWHTIPYMMADGSCEVTAEIHGSFVWWIVSMVKKKRIGKVFVFRDWEIPAKSVRTSGCPIDIQTRYLWNKRLNHHSVDPN